MWTAILLASVGCYLLKLAGLSLPERVLSHPTVERVADLGIAVGREVVRLLAEHPDLSPRDVVYLCEYHHDGLAAAGEIEAAVLKGWPLGSAAFKADLQKKAARQVLPARRGRPPKRLSATPD